MPRGILLKSAIKPSGKLPGEYQELKYIQSTGSQYIDTGVTPTINTVSQIKFMPIAITGDAIYGYGLPDTNDYRMFNYSSSIYFDFGSSRISGSTCSVNNIYEFEIGNYYVKKVGASTNLIQSTSIQSYTAPTGRTILLNYGGSVYAQVRWYYVKIYENGTLVRDLIPCYRIADDETGMYDLVTQQFFAKIGTTQYTKGPEVHPLGPATVSYDFKTQDVLTFMTKQNSYTGYGWTQGSGYYCHEQNASYYRTNVVYQLPAADYTGTLRLIKLTVNPDNLYSGAGVTTSTSSAGNRYGCGLGGWDVNTQNRMSLFNTTTAYNYNTGSQVLVIDLDDMEMYVEGNSSTAITLTTTHVSNLQTARTGGNLYLNIVANLPGGSGAKTYIEALEVFTY